MSVQFSKEQFSKGQVLVHPQHGPGTVTKVANRVVQGTKRQYLLLRLHADGMSVALPVDAVDELGVRAVMTPKRVREIFAVLTGESEPFDKVWSRRFKHNTERLRSGDLLNLAGLIRDVARRNAKRRVSYGEGNLLQQAMDLLTAELAIALDVTPERAVELVETAALERVAPTLDDDLALAS